MLTYELKKKPGVPLYEALYRCIRQDILSGNLKPGEKLPSKRALAAHLELGKITVEAAYAQLLSEGYIRSREKVGFFVEAIERPPQAPPPPPRAQCTEAPPLLDLTANGTGHFPFSVWSKLQREVILDYGRALLLPLPSQGIPELREAIAAHLAAFRGPEGRRVEDDGVVAPLPADFPAEELVGVVRDPADRVVPEAVQRRVLARPLHHALRGVEVADLRPAARRRERRAARIGEEVEDAREETGDPSPIVRFAEDAFRETQS